MAEDVCRRLASEHSNMNTDIPTHIYNEALILLEDLCLQIANKHLHLLGMPSPNRSAAASLDVELRRELNYNKEELLSYVQSNLPKLTFEQKGIYDTFTLAANNGVVDIFFLDAPGGTGKTFLIT
jgi:hypothetical protein